MMYSVWNQATRRFDYYRDDRRSEETSSPKPKHLSHHTLGATPEEAAWPLPEEAVLVGHGKYPKGYVASLEGKRGALGTFLFGLDLTLTNIALLGALGFVGWKYVLPKLKGN